VRPRKLLRIARWEITKGAAVPDRETLAVVVLTVALVALVGPLAVFSGVGLEDGLYRVGVDETSPYYEVAAAEETFVVVAGADREQLTAGGVDLLVDDGRLHSADTDKGAAARETFRDAVRRYNERQLRLEPNLSAAFPVEVSLEFREQGGIAELVGAETGDSAGEATDSDDDADSKESDNNNTGAGTDGGDTTDSSTDSGDTESRNTDSGDTESRDTDSTADSADDGPDGPLSDVLSLPGNSVTGSPAELSAPFPFQSLVLAFLFIIPLNFLIQLYGSTILSERLDRRGELLLVAPVSRGEIIGGKTLPYVVGAMVVEATLAVGLVYLVQGRLGGLVSVLAVTPLVMLFLGTTFLGAMFARSYRELTFVTVTITVGLTAYAFVPAIFTDVNEIALISPLTLVVQDLQAETVSLPAMAFSLTPPLLVAGVCFALGAGLYREEDMFAQRSIPGRVLDALAGPVTARWQVGVMTMVLVPLVFVAQLFAIALFFPLGAVGPSAVVLVLVVVVVTEEVAKSVHVYAAYEHGRFDRGLRTALVLGLASGAGFFLAEKVALLAQLVGLPDLAVGEAGLLGGVATGPVLLLFLLAPLTLHVVTAVISAVGASHGRRWYTVAVVVAMAVHLLYNLSVVILSDVV
jgi:ABC-type Na+ efflux pump permease subunit